ncbi:unnamed protein product [Acanthoscelides obtectus]|uniref:Uncharacterized protein n=1 Tax=Acanthoscelides obtectus TaxID=200917 RepID=A0A9P0KTS8_ACAOB|nr:unnamed protein product [Acanthoscelides obtectus]CAK1674821.1 hypothetical protein AOBTE_LOCUS29755 [Acanthoscelides obtectus]
MAEYRIRSARGFSLYEALPMIEYDKVQADTITLFSPDNASENLADENSAKKTMYMYI